MFTCNVFRMFFVFCVLVLQFLSSRLSSPIAAATGAFLSSFMPYELHWPLVLGGVLFVGVVGQVSCSRPFLVVAVFGRPLHEVFAGSSISCLHQAQNVFVVDGRGESTHIPPNPSGQLPRPAIGGWILTEKPLLFSLTVVPAVFGGCKAASDGSPSSTRFEPGADVAADPSASTLLQLAAELATTLLLAALRFPSKWLIVLLDHVNRDVGK